MYQSVTMVFVEHPLNFSMSANHPICCTKYSSSGPFSNISTLCRFKVYNRYQVVQGVKMVPSGLMWCHSGGRGGGGGTNNLTDRQRDTETLQLHDSALASRLGKVKTFAIIYRLQGGFWYIGIGPFSP